MWNTHLVGFQPGEVRLFPFSYAISICIHFLFVCFDAPTFVHAGACRLPFILSLMTVCTSAKDPFAEVSNPSSFRYIVVLIAIPSRVS
jgi:hypothetical protein